MTANTDVARRGRKRSDETRLAILRAALDLCATSGFASLTIEGIAAHSGAGKQTIYRWWDSKADVLLDALATESDVHVPVPNEGSFVADLRGFLIRAFALNRDKRVADVLRALIAQAQIDEKFGARFRSSYLQRRRDSLTPILVRAQERGELPPGISASTLCDIVFGTIWYWVLGTREPLDLRLAEELTLALNPGRNPLPHSSL